MKTIVVGYDGTEASERALTRSGDLATAFESSVILMSVSPVMTGAAHGGGSFDPTDPPEEHEALLDRGRAALAERGIQAEAVLGTGDPAEAIVQLAEQRSADLIVVGTREPGFWERVLGHSISAAVQRHARCDVLIVH
ncbi:MAG TPA: universal stress protein [Gaiellaceae bacterium]|nr:universal stress protein [Gaiellaceae bacterium]